jgi:hypothetical protein
MPHQVLTKSIEHTQNPIFYISNKYNSRDKASDTEGKKSLAIRMTSKTNGKKITKLFKQQTVRKIISPPNRLNANASMQNMIIVLNDGRK